MVPPLEQLKGLEETLDLSKTFILAGPLPSLDTLSQFVQSVGAGQGKHAKPTKTKLSLVEYVEAQFGDFVRAMKLGSAQDLYPTFIRAVERPLIELALQETNGNQMQAARLLGVNRNTLRKKIKEFNISVDRCKSERKKKKPIQLSSCIAVRLVRKTGFRQTFLFLTTSKWSTSMSQRL